MQVGVHGKEFSANSLPLVEHILQILISHGAEPVVSSSVATQLKAAGITHPIKIYTPGAKLQHVKFMLSLGGDGTLLETVTHVHDTGIPILGINLGKLGFLATINKDETSYALEKVFQGAYTIDKRTLLKLESPIDFFNGVNFALNDITVVKKDSSTMITVHTYIDNEYLNSYWADGLIISTPTGSTGYNLSCGGPLVFPKSGNFIITPVSPHNLTVRPIVVADSSIITLKVEGKNKDYLITLDSRVATGQPLTTLTIKKEKFIVNLVQLDGQHYFKTLRQKLNWGFDIRN